MDDNRSLDITDLLSRIHRQAVLVGGPHDGKRAPLPPMIYGEHPQYLCQPGRPGDQTYYHYRLTSDTTYVYVDHCNTLAEGPHNPGDIPDEEERSTSQRILFVAVLTVVLACSGSIMAAIGWAIYSFFK